MAPSCAPCLGVLLLAVAGLAAPRACADIFHLSAGSTIEGDLLGQEEGCYRIRTLAGVVSIPQSAVQKIVPSTTPFAEYETRRAAAQSADDHVRLAAWCGEQGMNPERRTHFERAIELDADNETARRALGYVRIGGNWVDGRVRTRRSAAPPTTAPAGEAAPAEARRGARERGARDPAGDGEVADAIQRQWFLRIRAIRKSYVEAPSERSRQEGAARIRDIHDPLAILPLAQVLGEGNLLCREVLVEALSRFAQDEATLNLAVLALVDPDALLRRKALTELVRRQDPRIAPQFRKALLSDNEAVTRRAAVGLAALGAKDAVPDLIEVLTIEQRKWVEVPVPAVLGGFQEAFNRPTVLNLAGASNVSHTPAIGVGSPTMAVESESRLQLVTVYRTEVLEALKTITGKNFGFDRQDWVLWYQEQKP